MKFMTRASALIAVMLTASGLLVAQGRGRGAGAGGHGAGGAQNQGQAAASNGGNSARPEAEGGGPASAGHHGPPFAPSGWSEGRKEGWGKSDVPPGLASPDSNTNQQSLGDVARQYRQQKTENGNTAGTPSSGAQTNPGNAASTHAQSSSGLTAGGTGQPSGPSTSSPAKHRKHHKKRAHPAA